MDRQYIVIGSPRPKPTAKQLAALKTRWPKQTLSERFWSHVEKQDSCWLWTAYRIPQGYGVFNIHKGKWVYAHRMSYSLTQGRIPSKLHVLHKCDVPACVRPSHLWIGTHQDNMRDRREKGRLNRTPGALKVTPNRGSK